jgi:hypothetical protein
MPDLPDTYKIKSWILYLIQYNKEKEINLFLIK